MIESLDIKSRLKFSAGKLGFTHVGVAAAEPLRDESLNLQAWLSRGFHASMSWMERRTEKRTDPAEYFPGAKSVISFGMNYYTRHRHQGDTSSGKISRYAWGADYHDLMKGKMQKLADELKKLVPDASFQICCDTAPVMEKVWAVRAGIGWRGKHTNVITRDMGSWVFLGEIITDLTIEPDSPIPDFCGTCTACIDACPTGAIKAPYLLDSNLCISYLTIEHRSDFPDDTPSLDGWFFGCDVCQDVCPWNRFQAETGEPAFQPGEAGIEIDLEKAAEMSDGEFMKLFRKSPVRRAKPDGFRRNAMHILAR